MLGWLKRLFGLGKRYGASGRTYYFKLPYTIDAMRLSYAVKWLKKSGMWERLPSDMRQKITRSSSAWHPVKVTKDDLDRLDDATWKAIAKKLNLKWR